MFRTEWLDAVGDTRLRGEGADEAEDLAFRSVLGQRQELPVVLFSKVWGKQHEPGEMELSVGNLLKDYRELSSDSRDAGATERRILRKAKLIHTVHVEAWARANPMNAARFDFREMGEKLSQHLVRASDQAARAGEQIGVRDMLETVRGLRGRSSASHAQQHTPTNFELTRDAVPTPREAARVFLRKGARKRVTEALGARKGVQRPKTPVRTS